MIKKRLLKGNPVCTALHNKRQKVNESLEKSQQHSIINCSLITNISTTYKAHRNEQYSYQMSKYMRNQFQFFGIKSPDRRKLDREILEKHCAKINDKEIKTIILRCWEQPEREMQYFGQDFLSKHLKTLKKDAELLQFVEKLIVTKSWWDTVDILASSILGEIVKSNPQVGLPYIDQWIVSENMWLRRSAIIHQLKYKHNTDKERLFRFCSMCSHEKEFFIQKAIGWALREYAKTEPTIVKQYVAENEHKLAKLSKREALKHLK